MLATLRNKIINVKPKDVLENARSHDLDVDSISDFRKFGYHYDRIEEVMDDYCHSFSRYNAFNGSTTGRVVLRPLLHLPVLILSRWLFNSIGLHSVLPF